MLQSLSGQELSPNTTATIPVSMIIALFFTVFIGLFGSFFIGILSFVVSPLISIVIFATLCITVFVGGTVLISKAWGATTYEIHNDKITQETNLFGTKRKSVPYSNVTDVTYNQSAIQSMFNVGTIKLNTSGSDDKAIKIQYVDDSEKIYEELSTHINNHESS